MKRFPKKYSKLLFSIIASLVLAFTMCGTTAQLVYADDSHVHDGITFTAWESDSELPSQPGNYYLTKNVTLPSDVCWTVHSDEINLCLNEHSITAERNGSSCIDIKGGTLNLYDCKDAGKITNARGGSNGGAVWIDDDGTFNMYGGTISGNNASLGGGVYCGGTFNMYGGTISGNDADEGGGVYCCETFNMYGGTISGNDANYGGGVSAFGGKCEISGGMIKDNTATVSGGGVFVLTGRKIQLRDSPQVTGNTVNGEADNIYVAYASKAEITGPLNRPDNASEPQIGISMYTPEVFTSGLKNNLPSGKTASYLFFSDKQGFGVEDTDAGEAQLVDQRIDIASENVTLSFDVVTYTAKETDPATMTLKLSDTDSRELTLGTDYEITSYKTSDNLETSKPKYAGTYKATVKGIGNYKGEAIVNFIIKRAPLTITAKDQTYVYDGKKHGPGDTIYEDPAEIADLITVDGLQKVNDTDCDRAARIEVDGQGQEIGDSPIIPSNATIKNGNKDVTDNYAISYVNGKLSITKPKPASTVNKAAAKIALDAGMKGTSTAGKVSAQWGKVTGADSYVIYAAFCGKEFHKVKEVSGITNMIDITKVGSKSVGKENVKYYVVAYQTVNGKKVQLAKSIVGHVAGVKHKKYTNPKAVKVKKSSYTLKKGKTAKLKPRLVLQKKGKKTLKHEAKFRYATTNAKVATAAKGKIKAVGKGNCTIYVYAQNGCAKAIKVTVK